MIHCDRIYNKYCKPRGVPVCDSCSVHKPRGPAFLAYFYPRKQSEHKLVCLKTAYKTTRQRQEDWIQKVRSETLYRGRVILKKLKPDVNYDVQTFQNEIRRNICEIRIKGTELKVQIDNVIHDVMLHDRNNHRCLLQKNRMIQYIARIQKFENKYEQTAYRPVKFLRFIKTSSNPRIQDTPHLSQTSQISLSQETNMEALTKTLGEIQIIEIRKLLVGNKLLLTLMSSPVLQKSISVTGLTNCYHISGVNPHQVWESDGFNIILADTQKGDKLYNIEDPMQYKSGIHTVNT